MENVIGQCSKVSINLIIILCSFSLFIVHILNQSCLILLTATPHYRRVLPVSRKLREITNDSECRRKAAVSILLWIYSNCSNRYNSYAHTDSRQYFCYIEERKFIAFYSPFSNQMWLMLSWLKFYHRFPSPQSFTQRQVINDTWSKWIALCASRQNTIHQSNVPN